MELHVLGCDGSYPAANGACSGYLVHCGEEGSLLLDCGSGVLAKLLAQMDPACLLAVVITHWHNDHANDLLVLRYYLLIHGKKLSIYAPPPPPPWRALLEGEEFIFHDLAKGAQLGGVSISALPVAHSMPALAVKVVNQGKQLVYTGDVSEAGNLPDFCQDVDLLICDGTYLAAAWYEGAVHMSAQQAAALGSAAGVKRTLITHFPPTRDRESLLSEARQIVPTADIARNGLRMLV